MPVANTSVTDIVAVCVLIASLLFSHEAAAVIGPYVVIIVASTVGASFALARRDKAGRGAAVWFFARVVGLAILLTAFLAAVASRYYPAAPDRLLVAPIALVVGYIGDDWGALLGKVVRLIFAAVDLVRGNGGAH